MAMGGGSIMRAAAKVAGIGVVNTGLRGGVIPESPISAAARTVSRPVGAIAAKSSPDSVRTSVTIDTPDVEKPRWGVIDDWEFAGGDEEILAVTGDPLPRLVFGGPPTIDEAKKATDELKDVLEKVYVSSPKSDGYEGLHGSGGYSSCLLQLSSTDVIENKACLTSAPSTSKHAIQAFRLLDQSPEVQGVVASIASDPKVWEAVLGNRELQSYLQSHIATNSSVHQNVRESLVQGDILRYQEYPMSCEVFSESGKSDGNVESETGKSEDGESNSKNEFLGIWKNIKLAVVDMMSCLSDYFNSLFGAQGGDNKGTENSNPDPAEAVVEKFLGPALVGVVVMVIMVVLMKRV